MDLKQKKNERRKRTWRESEGTSNPHAILSMLGNKSIFPKKHNTHAHMRTHLEKHISDTDTILKCMMGCKATVKTLNLNIHSWGGGKCHNALQCPRRHGTLVLKKSCRNTFFPQVKRMNTMGKPCLAVCPHISSLKLLIRFQLNLMLG